MSYPLLQSVQEERPLQDLTIAQLSELAEEIRHCIISTMAQTGGHLATNLGSIEFSLALHYLFSSPEDKFIFDVSHQSYTHKLLTGRYDRFNTIRQHDGLCGFTHPHESEHDHFHAGHAGTALSLALGVATNRDLSGGSEHVIPVIGDATLTCGLALEALNNIPRDLKNFIVILNDNAMSISKNVGAITQILSRLLNNPTSNKIFHDLENLVSKIPSYGTALAKQGQKMTESLKHLVSQASFFEQYNLSYIGPIDGHDIRKTIDTLEAVKNSSNPVILHLLTKKGKGMEAAVQNPITWHGAKPFDPETCKFHSSSAKKISFPQLFGREILSLAEEDPELVVITPAMSKGSCLDELMQKHPERCIDVGIAEGHAVTYSGGIALGNGKKVVVSIYATFLQRALDNLFHDVCLQELPVVFAIDRGGIAAGDGATHHGIYDMSFLQAMPNMVITQPRNGQLLKELLHSAFSWGRPTAIRYPNLPTEEVEAPLQTRELGKAEVLAEGKEILIIALGHLYKNALEVRERLLKLGHTCTVIDPIFVKPLDSNLLHNLLLTHHKIVTLEEHSVVGGLGSAINHFLITRGLTNVQVINLGVPEKFIDHGSHSKICDELGLSPEKIVQKMIDDFSLEPSPIQEVPIP